MNVQKISDIDWDSWEPVDIATLLFIFENDHILLIHKKRGLGAGKINGPGGRVEPGETKREAAIREVQEEVHVTPKDIHPCGELKFQFTNGYSIHGYVYKAFAYDGTPAESDEAIPFWCPIQDIPYEKMWSDDKYWFPHLLQNQFFMGTFIFDDDTMLSRHIIQLQEPLFS